ncbi:hypothetical protein [Kitasatospora sp. NPDC090091]|uniref:hypothetical protein n=1 Tax=Kitasatospora sp. NPDC090091 TaxID=3364081 RepID=UPI003809739A
MSADVGVVVVGGPVVRPGVRSVTRLLDEKGEFPVWEDGGRSGFSAERVKAGSEVAGATVRVSWVRPTTLEDEPAVVVAERLAMTEQLRRFLVANRYAVRCAPDRLSLLLLSPVAQRVVDGEVQHGESGVVTAEDRSVREVPMPVPAGRWWLMFWERWDSGLRGIAGAADVAAAVEWAGRKGSPVVLGGEGTVWTGGAVHYHPEQTEPSMERWTPYAVPKAFVDLRQEHRGVARQCAKVLLPVCESFRRELFDTAGGQVETSEVVDRAWAVESLESLLQFPLSRVEANGAGVVRVWRWGGGVTVWTPVQGR